MKEKNISGLVKRYEQMLGSGRSVYFDAGEFDDLADYYDMLDDLDTSKKIIELGLKIHPENYSLLLKNAKFIIYAGEYHKALEYLNKTFGVYNFEAYLLKIECLLSLDSYDEANALTQEVINDEDNDDDIVFSELGFLYAEADYYDDAVSFFEQSLAFNPENVEVLMELSYAYEMCDNYSQAIDISNKILDMDPYSYDAWINVGKLYTLLDEYEKAIDAFDFALTINDSDINILKLKAHCFSLSGRAIESIGLFKECIEMNPADKSLYYSLSDCYFSMEMYNEMLYCLDKYEELHGETTETIAKRALAHLQKEDMEQAYLLLQSGIGLDPESEDINIVMGEFYFRLEEYSKSEDFFLKVYKKGYDDGTMLDRLSFISISKNDMDKAIEYTEKLVSVNRNQDDYLSKIRLALLYFETDNKQKFNQYLDTFDNEELKSLFGLFFSEDSLVSSSITRDILINKLNDARECRQLFKNIVY